MTEPDTMAAEILGSAPDPAQVRALAKAVIQAAGITREQITAEAERLQGERDQLARSVEKLHSDVADYEAHRGALQEKEQQLHDQELSLSEAREQMLQQEQSIQDQAFVLGDKATRLEKFQAEVVAAETELRKREQALQAEKQEIDAKLRELIPKQKELNLRAVELEAQASELEQKGDELEELRETLTEMQAQLKTDHNEVTAHREELLRRLSRLPDHHAEHQEPVPAVLEISPASNGWGPKPASAGGIDQFRKLRRDAKRRAIGV
jgi:chromosome segregation ATPase